METHFEDPHLELLWRDPNCKTKWDHQIVKGFRWAMGIIRNAKDERDLREIKSLRFEKMKGDLSHFRTVRVTDQWRLFLRIEDAGDQKRIVIVKIDDPH